MVRQTKRFKKGLNKKVLSAILAASMIMTSSSFAFAAPVDGSLSDDTATATEANAPSNEEAGIATLSEESEAENAPVARIAHSFDELDSKLGGFDASDPNTLTFPYDGGNEVKPEVVLTDYGTNYVLKEGSDYHLTYDNCTDVYDNVGYATVTIEFDGATYGDLANAVIKYKVVPNVIHESDVTVVFATEESLVYNGKEQFPEIASVTVRDGEDTYQLSPEDYVIGKNFAVRDDYTSVGEHSVYVKAVGNYSGILKSDYRYQITPAKLSEDTATVTVDPIAFEDNKTSTAVENEIAKSIVVHDDVNDRDLRSDEYDIWYMNEQTGEYTSSARASASIGVHQMRVYGVKNYDSNSYVDVTYEVVEDNSLQMKVNDLLSNWKFYIGDGKTYAGEGKNGFSVEYNGTDRFVENDELKCTGDLASNQYTVVTPAEDWTNAGTYYIVLEGKNDFAGETARIPVKVTSKKLNTSAYAINGAQGITCEVKQGTHRSGAEGSLEVVIKDSFTKQTLQEGVDYTVDGVVTEYEGKKRVVITGIGNYTTKAEGTAVYKQEIEKNNKLFLNDESISAEVVGDFVYTGSDIKPTASDIKLVETDGNNQYEITDADFYVKGYKNNKNAGEATVTIAAKSGSKYYTGERDITFTIAGLAFEDTFEFASIGDVAIGTDWSDVLAQIQVKYQSNGAVYSTYNAPQGRCTYEILKDGKRVTATDLKGEITESGTYTVVAKPVGSRYAGSLETTFTVKGVDIAQNTTVSAIEDQVYTGEAIEPKVTVKNDNMTLEEGKDYTLSYSGNVEGGTAVVIVNGIGNYSGTVEKEFIITQGQQEITMTNPLQERDLANGSRTTTSKACTLKLGYALEDKNMSLSYATSDPSVATVNNGKITYEGVGECTITVTAKETNNCKADTLEIKVKVGKPGTPTFTPTVSSKTAKKSFVVTSSTVKGADGFEVQYSIRPDWWKATTKDFSNIGAGGKLYRQTLTTYHSNKTYYIHVRAYQVVNGEKVYSEWSPMKTAKTK